MNRLASLTFAALATAGALTAQDAAANCDRLFEALGKADKQERSAMYDVDSRDQPLTGKPMSVRIGDKTYDGSFAGPAFGEHTTNGANPVLAALRKQHQQGTLKCDAAGSDTYRGAPVEKIRFVNPMLPAKFNPMTIWIAKSSGLPVYHELHDLGPGGFAWVYGDAVRQPQVVKKP